MARLSKLLSPNTTAPLGAASDYLFLLRLDEGAAASNLVDALGARTMTQTASPTVVRSIFQPNRTTLGSRGFNGTTQFGGRVAGDGDNAIFQGLTWGCAFWFQPNALSVAGIVEYGEFGATANENVQGAIDLLSNGAIRRFWQTGTKSNHTIDSAAGVCAVGVTVHVGVSCEPDIDNPGNMTLRLYINGECVAINNNLAPPTGGSNARWIVGASRNGGSAVNTPGSFLNGSLQDMVFAQFTPSAEFFRALYANGVRDFQSDFGGRLFSVFTRVLVEDSDGRASTAEPSFLRNLTDYDLTNINGWNFLRSVEFGENIDDAGMAATIKFHPRVGDFNLSPFVDNAASPGVGSTFDNLLVSVLAPMKRIKIETATVPYLMGMNESAAAPYFVTQFDGFIQAIDVAADEVTVTAMDRIKSLQNTWIEPARDGQDRKYGSNAGTATVETQLQKIIDDNDPARFELLSAACAGAKITFTVLSTSTVNGQGKAHALIAGDTIVVTGTTNYNGTYTVDASSTATAIITQETHGAVATENNIGILQAAPALSYLGLKPTISVPTSPSWNLWEWNEPSSKSVQQSLEDIVAQIGWRVGYRWDDNIFAFRLQLFDPTASPDLQDLVTGEMLTVSRMSIKDDDTRNVDLVEYASDANLDPTKERPRFITSSVDVASVRANGRRFCRVTTGSDSLITRSNEAQALANKITSDLSTPASEMEFEVKYDPTWEIGDIVRFANEVLTDSQMPIFFASVNLTEASVIEVRHTLDSTKHRTRLVVRKFLEGSLSSSVSRVNKWWDYLNVKGSMRGRGTAAVQTPAVPSILKQGAINGVVTIKVFWQMPSVDYGRADLNRAWAGTEVHVSATNGFTPSATTLQDFTLGASAIIHLHDAAANFVGGTIYYVKIVHRDRMGNRVISPITNFTA